MKNLLLCIAVLSMTTIAYAQDKLTPGPGEVELTYVGKGTQLGVWNPTTKVYTIPIKYKEGPLAGQYRSLTFTEDGKVLNGEGTEVGSKQPDGSWKTAQMEKVFRSSYNVFWKTEIVGNILETMVSIHGLPMVQTSAPMDQDVLTFLVFCNHYAGRLDKIKEEVKKEKERQAKEAAANYKPTEFRKGLKADRIEISGNTVYAYSKGKRIGHAEMQGDDIVVYTEHSTGSKGRIQGIYNPSTDSKGNIFGSSRIDFLGHTNHFDYSRQGDNTSFYGELHASIGEVREYGSEYFVYDAKGNNLGKFPASLDPRFGALFLYEFFDPLQY